MALLKFAEVWIFALWAVLIGLRVLVVIERKMVAAEVFLAQNFALLIWNK